MKVDMSELEKESLRSFGFDEKRLERFRLLLEHRAQKCLLKKLMRLRQKEVQPHDPTDHKRV